VFTELVIVRILDFMKVVFVQLPYKTREIRMLKHPRQDGFREFVHVLQIDPSVRIQLFKESIQVPQGDAL